MSEDHIFSDRMLSLGLARVSEAAAIAAAKLVGRGDEKAADQAAVDAMRTQLNLLDIKGVVVIGEGERDEVPMLYIGEKAGEGYDAPASTPRLFPRGHQPERRGHADALAVIALLSRAQCCTPPTRTWRSCGRPRATRPASSPSTSRRPSASGARPRQGHRASVTWTAPRARAPPGADRGDRLDRRPYPADHHGDVAGAIHAMEETGIDIMGTGGAPEGVLALPPQVHGAGRRRPCDVPK